MSLENLSTIVKKNFKILWRSKVSAITIIFVPLIVVLLVGIGFSTSSFGSMSVGVFSEDPNDLTNSSLDIIKEKGYEIKKYSSEDQCERPVKDGGTKICLVFPKNLSIETEESIKIYADQSRTDIAYYLINSLQSQISKKASGIGEREVQKLIDSLNKAKEAISSIKGDVSEIINKVNSIENSASDISSKEIDLDSLLEKIEDINSSLENVENQSELVAGIKEDLDEVKTKISNINSSFSDISRDSDEISSDLSSLKNKAEKVESNLNKLHQELSSEEILNAKNIINPLKTDIKPIEPQSSNWNNMFPSFLLIVILFCGIILSSSLIIRERKAGASFRNSITSTSSFTFILGTYITCLIILFLQLTIVLSGVHFIIGTSLTTLVGELALAIFFSSSIFIFLGMLIGYSFKSEETTMIVSISLVSLFLFFSNAIFPLESISGSFQKIIQYNPAAISNELFRKIVLFNYETLHITKELLLLGGTLITSFLLAFFAKKTNKKSV